MATIDPCSPVPKYFQLREILLDLIDEAGPARDVAYRPNATCPGGTVCRG